MAFGLLIGSVDPVRTTGFPTFSSMKLSTDAVYAIVSVPCRITNLMCDKANQQKIGSK